MSAQNILFDIWPIPVSVALWLNCYPQRLFPGVLNSIALCRDSQPGKNFNFSVDDSKTYSSGSSLANIKIDLLSCRSEDTKPPLTSAKGHFRGESFGVTDAKVDPIKVVSKQYLTKLYKRAVIKLNPVDRLNEILTENEELKEKIETIELSQQVEMLKLTKKATQLIKENEELQLKI